MTTKINGYPATATEPLTGLKGRSGNAQVAEKPNVNTSGGASGKAAAADHVTLTDSAVTLQKLSAADPGSGEFRSDVANAMRLLGDVELASGDAATALTQERSALDLLHAMPEADRDENLQLYSLQASVTAGEAELKLGHTREAITDFQTAAAIGDKLVARDPDHAYDRLDRVRAKTKLVLALAADGQCRDAEPLFQQTVTEWRALREMDIVPHAEAAQAEKLEAALRKCR